MKDEINHPSHYMSHPSGLECITIVRHMCFNLGNVFKYVWRAGLKHAKPNYEMTFCEVQKDRLRDLKKARWYLDDEIQRVENDIVELEKLNAKS